MAPGEVSARLLATEITASSGFFASSATQGGKKRGSASAPRGLTFVGLLAQLLPVIFGVALVRLPGRILLLRRPGVLGVAVAVLLPFPPDPRQALLPAEALSVPTQPPVPPPPPPPLLPSLPSRLTGEPPAAASCAPRPPPAAAAAPSSASASPPSSPGSPAPPPPFCELPGRKPSSRHRPQPPQQRRLSREKPGTTH